MFSLTTRNGDYRAATRRPISRCEMSETFETEKSLQMAIIIAPGHPTKEFSDEFAQNLQETLVNAMYAVEDGPIPVFDEFELSNKKNYIRVNCFNGYSKKWLIDAVKKLSPFEEKTLLAVEEETVPELRLFYVFVPCSASSNTNDLLTRIKKSTPNLKVDFWKIRETKAVTKGTAVNIEIDTFSIGLIEEKKYAVRLGMGWVHFWDHENNKGHQAAEFLAVTGDDLGAAMVQSSSKLSETVECQARTASSGSLKVSIFRSSNFVPTRLVPNMYHRRIFSYEVRKALISAIDAIVDDPIPLFDGIDVPSEEYIVVTCSNEYSKKWLIDAVKKLPPFEGEFPVVEEDTVPELREVYVFVPDSAIPNTDDLLTKIKRSTPNLKTECWKIITSNDDIGLIIEVDTSSIRMIEEMGYSVHVGMGRAYFWDDENAKGHPQAQFMLFKHIVRGYFNEIK